MKKVLIITYYWPPSGGSGVQRWVKFAKYLRAFGWEPIIYTVSDGEYPVLDQSLQNDLPENLTVLKQPIFEPFKYYKKLVGKSSKERVQQGVIEASKNGSWKDKLALWIRSNVFIPDARMFWIKPSIKYLKQYLKQNPVDVVISTGPPHSAHLIALGLKQQLGVKWVADFRDPWTKIFYFNTLTLTSWARKKHEQLELEVLKQADEVLVVGKGMQEDFMKDLKIKTTLIPNGYDTSDFDTTSDFKQEKLNNPIFTIVHTGTLMYKINPENLWLALIELYEEGNLDDTEIYLYGMVDEKIKEELEKTCLKTKIHYVNYIPHNEINEIQSKAKLLLLPLETTTPVLSGKFFEYLGSQSTILALGNDSVNFEVKTILEHSNSGIFVNTTDKQSIKKYILELKNTSYQRVVNTSYLNQFTRENLTQQLTQVLNKL